MTTQPDPSNKPWRPTVPLTPRDADHLVNLAETKIEALKADLAACEARLTEVQRERDTAVAHTRTLFRFVDGMSNYRHILDDSALREVGESAHRVLFALAHPTVASTGEADPG